MTTDETTNLKSLNYTGLIPYTVAALREVDIRLAVIPEFEDRTLATNLSEFLRTIVEDGRISIEKVFTKEVHTETLCLGTEDDELCVTKEQLQNMLKNSNSQTIIVMPSEPDSEVPLAEEPTQEEEVPENPEPKLEQQPETEVPAENIETAT